MLSNLDENLIRHKETIIRELKRQPIQNFNSFNNNFQIKQTNLPPKPITITTGDVFSKQDNEMVSYRILETVEEVGGRNYQIYIQKSLIENEDLIQTIVVLQASMLLFLLTGLFILNRKIASRIWEPFYNTLEKLRKYNINENRPLHLSSTPINELADLNQSLEILTDNANKLFRAQKEFTENASHELQTPIAIIQGKLELLMQTNPLNKEQAKLISEVYDAGQRMSRLNKTLLILSKIENNQFSHTDIIETQQIVRSITVVYNEIALSKNISMNIEFCGNKTFYGNQQLFEILISNLLNNAITHSARGSSIRIKVLNKDIIICNSSKGLALNEKKLFKRFQRQTSNEQSTGLGLEIAQKIAKIYSAEIRYHHQDNHHCFTVAFT